MYAKFYAQQTGEDSKRGKQRIKSIKAVLECWGLTVEEAIIENHLDYKWSARSNRTELEKLAVMIGYTNSRYHGWPTSMYWLIPLVMPKATVEEIAGEKE